MKNPNPEIHRSASPLLEPFRPQAVALGILVLIAYANALGSSFHFDDSAIFANPQIVSPGWGLDLFGLNQTRPLTYLTFHWNFLLGGTDPLLYHVFNLLLHAANCILLLAFSRRYLSPLAAAAVAALYALHPLQTESVTYVFSRSTLLSTHFALWTLWFFAREKYRESALLFGISLLAKEETIALPGLLLLLTVFEHKRPKPAYFAALATFAGVAAARLFYLIASAPVDPGVGRVKGISTGTYLLTQFRVLWIYLRQVFAPYDLNLDRDVTLSTGLFSPGTTITGLAGLALLCGGLVWLAWKHRQPAALWALGFFVLISPSSSIVAQADLYFEHRTYLPLVCLFLGFGFLFERLPRRWLTAATAVLIPVLLSATISRNSDWWDEKTLWADIAKKSPGKGRSWQGMASAYADEPEKARAYLKQGLAVEPGNALLHTNYGIALLGAQQPAKALEHFQQAIALTEDTADRWNNVGAAYFRLNNSEAALRSFQRALTLDQCNFNAHRNLMMLFSTHRQQQAAYDAGAVPPACRMLPAQARELEALRRRVIAP